MNTNSKTLEKSAREETPEISYTALTERKIQNESSLIPDYYVDKPVNFSSVDQA